MGSNARLAEVQQRAETWKDIVKESCRPSTDTSGDNDDDEKNDGDDSEEAEKEKKRKGGT